jgi:hypothetical protein
MLCLCLFYGAACAPPPPSISPQEKDTSEQRKIIAQAVSELIKMQEGEGEWPYEGVYRVGKEIPIGYRVGGTAIVCTALLHAASPDDAEAQAALDRGIDFILKGLEDPLMTPKRQRGYDVRIWGHAYALECFCLLQKRKRSPPRIEEVNGWIPKLVDALVTEQNKGGGWSYISTQAHQSIVTAPVIQALLWARARGTAVPEEIFQKTREILESSRLEGGTFAYTGIVPAGRNAPDRGTDSLAGSAARSAVCETTLYLLGGGSQTQVRGAWEIFLTHWEELEKRRKQQGTHSGSYGIAPYYVYYGHRYAAQAIELLPETERAAERARFLEVALRTRDADGTWNDRVFPRSRNFGTAMMVLGLLGERTPLPPSLKMNESKKVK